MFFNFINRLYSSQTPFHFLDASTTDTISSVENGKLIVGKCKYDILVLNNIEVISSKMLKTIIDLSNDGGKIWIVNPPCRLDGLFNPMLTKTLKALKGIKVFKSNLDLIFALNSRNNKPF